MIADAAELVAELERLLPDWIDLEPARWQRVEYALRRAAGNEPVFPTFESFIEWVDEDTSAEWVEGEVLFMSPASTRHQLITGFLAALLRAFVEHHRLGTILTAPFKMKLPGYGAEPDILFIATANEDRLRRTFLDGPADMVVEIISPDSVERDRIKKFNEYEAAGIPEYWLIDPERESAEFYLLIEGRYQLAETPQNTYSSGVLPGFALPLAWMRHNQQPTLIAALRSLGIV
jgi:Uma2 family endonuclease